MLQGSQNDLNCGCILVFWAKHHQANNSVVVRFDGSELTNELYNFLINLGDILTDSGQLGEMAYAIFHLDITSLKNLHEVKKKFN